MKTVDQQLFTNAVVTDHFVKNQSIHNKYNLSSAVNCAFFNMVISILILLTSSWFKIACCTNNCDLINFV